MKGKSMFGELKGVVSTKDIVEEKAHDFPVYMLELVFVAWLLLRKSSVKLF